MKKESIILLKKLEEYGIDVFTKNDLLLKEFNDKAFRELIKQDYLSMIEKGKYCRYNFRDENVIASFIVKNGGVAYWTAMHYHGLTEQIPNTMYVQTTQVKRNQVIFGVPYNFIRVKKEKLIGFKTIGYGNHQFRITDIEKTIVDCFDLPQYGGGYAEILKAFKNANLSAQKLVKYCKAIDNIAVIKRLAYLSELTNKPKMDYFYKYALSVKNEKFNLFDSGGNKNGHTNSRWNLIMNMDEAEILEISNS
ncbi:MAG: type IV toxin-antitoxin system AbiEi family antitoxin [Bacteroidota bacterium]